MAKITVTLAALIAALFLTPRGAAIPSTCSGQALAAPQSCHTFTIENYSSHALGDVTIAGTGGQTDVTVPGTGEYDTTICYTAASVEINGQTVDYPNAGVLTLGDGSLVNVGWQSPDFVEMTDRTIITTPGQ